MAGKDRVFVNRQGVSFWHNEIVVELGSGDGCITL